MRADLRVGVLVVLEKVCSARVNDDQIDTAKLPYFSDQPSADLLNVEDADDVVNLVSVRIVSAQRVGADQSSAHIVGILADKVDHLSFVDGVVAERGFGVLATNGAGEDQRNRGLAAASDAGQRIEEAAL